MTYWLRLYFSKGGQFKSQHPCQASHNCNSGALKPWSSEPELWNIDYTYTIKNNTNLFLFFLKEKKIVWKLGMGAPTCNLRAQESETGGLRV